MAAIRSQPYAAAIPSSLYIITYRVRIGTTEGDEASIYIVSITYKAGEYHHLVRNGLSAQSWEACRS